MSCTSCREALSARMDGETEQVDSEWTDRHLSTCADCQAWQREAARLSRAVRVRPAVATPDLTAVILAAAQRSRQPAAARRRTWRWLLGAVAVVQLGLGLSELLGVATMGMSMSGDSEHLFNESTAWNVALGIGFAVAAVWPRLAGGLLPTLGVFVAVLAAVSAVDLINGHVDLSRVGSHLVVVLGLAMLLVVHRQNVRQPGPTRLAYGDPSNLQDADRGAGTLTDRWPTYRSSRSRRGLRPSGRRAA